MPNNIKTDKNSMITLFKNTVDEIDALNLKKITASLEINFKNESANFFITIFDHKSNNKTFNCFCWIEPNHLQTELKKVIEIIKTDDFEQITAANINL